jgi:prolyl-tRNA editing enzyme YbaK/EbsC (Cys-tRNA(Pro) deacylase)
MSGFRTGITDLLDAQGVAYRVLPHSEPVYTVEAAARQRGVVKEEMVKSILLRDKDGRHAMACVMGDARLDPKAVRAHLPGGWKRLSFATAEEILAMTGCVQGAVAPLGLPEGVPVIFDEAVARCKKVSISSGDPMAGLELDARDLIKAARAQLAPVAQVRGNKGRSDR